MPSAEVVASALLQLKNNPRLFKKWRKQPGYAFKANGKMFRAGPAAAMRLEAFAKLHPNTSWKPKSRQECQRVSRIGEWVTIPTGARGLV
jgi:hypothetical protein